MDKAPDPIPYCLRLLAKRSRSEWELDQAMQRRAYESEARQAALEQLRELRLVDDKQFAHSWVVTRDRLAPRGEPVLRQELMLKGIPRPLIDATMAERKEARENGDPDQKTETQLAQDLISHRERQYAGMTPEIRWRRQSSLLQRKGFSYDAIKNVLGPQPRNA